MTTTGTLIFLIYSLVINIILCLLDLRKIKKGKSKGTLIILLLPVVILLLNFKI